MWTASNFSTFQKQFDFSSSGQGKSTYTSLKADDEVLINIIELFENDGNSTFQFLICEHCGITHCEPGNWLSVRQSGDFVLLIPAFNEILEEPESNEYNPPYFFNTKGALILTGVQFQNLKKIVSEFPNITNLKPLTGFEAISLYKWDTPHKMFGEFPKFELLRKNHISWTSELDCNSLSTIVADKLQALETTNIVTLVPIDKSQDVTISAILEGSANIEWSPLCKTAKGFELLIGNNFILKAE